MDTSKKGKGQQNKEIVNFKEKAPRPTGVLPIVGLDVGAIGSSSLLGFCSGGTFALWLFVFNFIKSFSIELRLPDGRFSNSPPSAILVRYAQLFDSELSLVCFVVALVDKADQTFLFYSTFVFVATAKRFIKTN